MQLVVLEDTVDNIKIFRKSSNVRHVSKTYCLDDDLSVERITVGPAISFGMGTPTFSLDVVKGLASGVRD